jgi:L-2,4-diaminobutyrate transaminase
MHSILLNDEVAARDAAYHLHPFTSPSAIRSAGPLVIERASGVHVHDGLGREFIDGAAGLWCVNVGHGRPEIAAAIASQMEKLSFIQTFNGLTHEPVARLAERIIQHAPEGMKRVFFGNSGSDANDSAVKIVWLYNNLRGLPAKKKIVSRMGAYHGVTVMAGSLTGLPSVHRLYDLPLGMVRHVSAPDRYHHPERTAQDYADEIDALIRREGPETVAAFIAEPVMGTGGVIVPPDGYFQAIAEVLKEHDVLLISDEVICGFGRLGAWFGADHFGIAPDLMTTAKGLTSSYLPMSAVLVGEKVWSVIDDPANAAAGFNHGFTTSSHPLAAAAALANLDIIENENLVARAGEMGACLLASLTRAAAGHDLVGDVRGRGLMAGLELVVAKETKNHFAPHVGVAARVQQAAIREGLLVRALAANDVIALSPPFIIDRPTIDEMVRRLVAALDRVLGDLVAEGLRTESAA